MTTALDFILAKHGSPDSLTISIDSILLHVVINGAATRELQLDLAGHFRKTKPSFTVMFDRDLLIETRTKRKDIQCSRHWSCSRLSVCFAHLCFSVLECIAIGGIGIYLTTTDDGTDLDFSYYILGRRGYASRFLVYAWLSDWQHMKGTVGWMIYCHVRFVAALHLSKNSREESEQIST